MRKKVNIAPKCFVASGRSTIHVVYIFIEVNLDLN
jgi:hypothetical protein